MPNSEASRRYKYPLKLLDHPQGFNYGGQLDYYFA